MKIVCKLYATLMAYLPPGTQGHAVTMEVNNTSVQEIIDHFAIPEHMAFLVMLNGVYIPPEDRPVTCLQENDVLAVWPKVAGG